MYFIAYPLLAIVNILNSLLFVLSLVIIATVVMSWVGANPYNPIVRTLNMITGPIYSRVAHFVPRIGPMDLTPLFVILGIQFIQHGILPIFVRIAEQMM